uniref:Uncharacterized protein n=1 Tax=Globodera pallida TaxID=36090 RepID=A0A183CCG3_GLOPA
MMQQDVRHCMMMLLIFAIFQQLRPLLVAGNLLSVDLVVNPPNFFDGCFRTFSKSSADQQIFGYNANTACQMGKSRNMYNSQNVWNIFLQDVDSLRRSGQVPVELPIPARPRACFEHNRHSFAFFDLMNAENEVAIIRGQQQKIAKRLASHGRVFFDHIAGRLFLIDKSERRINELELAYLEQWWTTNNNTASSVVQLKSNFVGFLPEQKTDFFIAASHVFLIWGRRIYKFRVGHYLNDAAHLQFLTNSSHTRFNFMIFINNYADKIVKTGSPPPAGISGDDKLWLWIAYIFDMAVLMFGIYALKKQFRRRNKSDVESNYDDDNNFLMMDNYDVMHALSLRQSGGGAKPVYAPTVNTHV